MSVGLKDKSGYKRTGEGHDRSHYSSPLTRSVNIGIANCVESSPRRRYSVATLRQRKSGCDCRQLIHLLCHFHTQQHVTKALITVYGNRHFHPRHAMLSRVLAKRRVFLSVFCRNVRTDRASLLVWRFPLTYPIHGSVKNSHYLLNFVLNSGRRKLRPARHVDHCRYCQVAMIIAKFCQLSSTKLDA